jgi:pimeloyl-ACP methyl ester carboxylesterase
MVADPSELAAERDAAAAAQADGPTVPASWWIRLGETVKAFPFGYRDLVQPFTPDSLDRVATDDGAFIALCRYAPRKERSFAEPVVLCHGTGANRYTFDLTDRYSLARRLAERGFEVWILELRGRGEAGAAASCTFDRQVQYDVGAALRSVTAAGAPGVLWVGHAKGGLLPLAHLGRFEDAPIRAVVTLGSPTTFTVQRGLKAFARVLRPLLDSSRIPIQNLARLSLWVPPPEWFMLYLAYSANIDPEIRKLALVNVSADVSVGIAREYLRWVTTGRWESEDGAVDYAANLSRVKAPTLLVAGAQDLLAPPDAVAHGAGLLGGRSELLVAGRVGGFKDDYGHGDLVLGRNAPDELHPKIIRFLERHATAA